MKTAKTYTLYSIRILCVALLLEASVGLSQKLQEKRPLTQEHSDLFERSHAVINLESTSIGEITYDYPFWNEIEAFDTIDNLASVSKKITPLRSSFHLFSIFIFNTPKTPVFSSKTALLDSVNSDLSLFYLTNGVSC